MMKLLVGILYVGSIERRDGRGHQREGDRILGQPFLCYTRLKTCSATMFYERKL